jgi:hypothetical protein
MGWTTPRDYVANEVLTAAILNVDHRDNLDVLSTHAHSGAAGMGSSSLANLVKATFTDASAPSAPGSGLTAIYTVSGKPHFRAGASGSDTAFAVASDLHAQAHESAHEPGGGDAMAVDASAATGSLRTIGSGSTQGAAGNHTHTISEDVVAEQVLTLSGATSAIARETISASGTKDADSTATVTETALLCGFGFGKALSGASDFDLSIDGVVVDNEDGTGNNNVVLKGSRGVSGGSRTVRMRYDNDTAGDIYLLMLSSAMVAVDI